MYLSDRFVGVASPPVQCSNTYWLETEKQEVRNSYTAQQCLRILLTCFRNRMSDGKTALKGDIFVQLCKHHSRIFAQFVYISCLPGLLQWPIHSHSPSPSIEGRFCLIVVLAELMARLLLLMRLRSVGIGESKKLGL